MSSARVSSHVLLMAALIILFPASFRYEFNAMDAIDGQQTELESALHNMLLIVFFLLVL